MEKGVVQMLPSGQEVRASNHPLNWRPAQQDPVDCQGQWNVRLHIEDAVSRTQGRSGGLPMINWNPVIWLDFQIRCVGDGLLVSIHKDSKLPTLSSVMSWLRSRGDVYGYPWSFSSTIWKYELIHLRSMKTNGRQRTFYIPHYFTNSLMTISLTWEIQCCILEVIKVVPRSGTSRTIFEWVG